MLGYLAKAYRVLRFQGPAALYRKTTFKLRTMLSERNSGRAYERWTVAHEAAFQGGFDHEASPLISIVVPVFNPDPLLLAATLDSVREQSYARWELCVANASTDPAIADVLRDYQSRDPRIKVATLSENLGIAMNTQAALDLATGEFVGFLDHDDCLASAALAEVASLLVQHPGTDLVYTDEDKLDEQGNRCEPILKSDWAPDLFLASNYLCHFVVVRKTVLLSAGGFRPGFDGAQDYDLLLRVTEQTDAIRHIPKILYHWRRSPGSTASSIEAKPFAVFAGQAALRSAMERRGIDAEVVPDRSPCIYRLRYRLKQRPLVTLIIPTRDQIALLRRCLKSLRKTTYPHYEILVVDNQSVRSETITYLSSLVDSPRVRVIRYDHPFNFQALNNYAARFANGEYLLFLNNDTEIVNPDWLEAMLELAQRPEVGAVGAKLYYPNGTIQHAGMILNVGLVAGHAHRGFPRESDGYCGRLRMIQNVSAVTGACLLTRRSVFEEVRGFDERYTVAMGDVDLCTSILSKGYRILWTPYAELVHHECKSRGFDETPEKMARFRREIDLFREKWPRSTDQDPFFNPNFDPAREDYVLPAL